MIYLLSFPRSGNTLLRYCVEKITGRPTNECKASKNKGSLHKTMFGTNIGKDYIMQKEHFARNVKLGSKAKLILLVRHPVNNILSHLLRANNPIQLNYAKKALVEYYANLAKYHNTKRDKLIIHYEDLMDDPMAVIRLVMEFIGFDDGDKINEFEENLDEHLEVIYGKYTNKAGTSTDRDDSSIYDKVGDKAIEGLYHEVRDKYKFYNDLYLIKYDLYGEQNIERKDPI